MKRILSIIGGLVLIGILIVGYKINSDLNNLDEAFHFEHNLDESNLVLLKEEVSPKEDFKFYEYKFDNGGFGYSRVFWSVIKNDPKDRGLEKGIIPDGYKAIKWTYDNELVLEKWKPYYNKDKKVVLSSGDEINGVKLKLKD